MLGRHLRGAAQPGIDILVGRGQQRLELVQARLVQPSHMALGIGAEDQIDLLETAPLGTKQKPFPAVLRRATLFEVCHGAGYSLRPAPEQPPPSGYFRAVTRGGACDGSRPMSVLRQLIK